MQFLSFGYGSWLALNEVLIFDLNQLGVGGIAAALELVPLPIALFVAGVPFLKLLNRPHATTPQRFISHLVDGAAKPVGGDSEGTVRWAPAEIKRMDSGRRRTNRSPRRRPSRRA